MDNLSKNDSDMIIDCGESLDVSVIMDFRALILQAMASDDEIILDATQLERIDGAAMQLLTALFKDADETNHPIRWKSSSDALMNAARLSGLCEALHLTSV
jgi:anti-anti-sigma regulatory factor